MVGRLCEHQQVIFIKLNNGPVVDANGTRVIYGLVPSTAIQYHQGTVQVQPSPGVPALLAAQEGQKSGYEPRSPEYHQGTVQAQPSPSVPALLAADGGQRSGNEPVGAGPPRIESIEDCSNLMMLAKAATLET